MPAAFLLSSVQNPRRSRPGARGPVDARQGCGGMWVVPWLLCPREGYWAVSRDQWILTVWKSPLWGVGRGWGGQSGRERLCSPPACWGL